MAQTSSERPPRRKRGAGKGDGRSARERRAERDCATVRTPRTTTSRGVRHGHLLGNFLVQIPSRDGWPGRGRVRVARGTHREFDPHGTGFPRPHAALRGPRRAPPPRASRTAGSVRASLDGRTRYPCPSLVSRATCNTRLTASFRPRRAFAQAAEASVASLAIRCSTPKRSSRGRPNGPPAVRLPFVFPQFRVTFVGRSPPRRARIVPGAGRHVSIRRAGESHVDH
jgi:hypothetical protein